MDRIRDGIVILLKRVAMALSSRRHAHVTCHVGVSSSMHGQLLVEINLESNLHIV